MIPEFFPRDRYYCVLDDQPEFLVPPHLCPNGTRPDDTLVFNPHAWFAWRDPLPAALAARAVSTDNFFDTPWMIWVDDVVTGAIWPFWLGRDYAHLLQHVAPGQGYDGGLPEQVVTVLQAAQVLVPPDFAARRRRAWLSAVDTLVPQFERGFVAVDGLVHPFHVGALRRYYRYHTRMGTFVLGDEQSPGRYVAYDESVTRFMHQQLTTAISDIARTVVRPSYSYLSLYTGGAALDPHIDREACEYTVSLAIDASPEPDAQVPWPLNLGLAEGSLAVWQRLGEGLLFRGRYLPHWRERLADGYTSSSVLLHYVDA